MTVFHHLRSAVYEILIPKSKVHKFPAQQLELIFIKSTVTIDALGK